MAKDRAQETMERLLRDAGIEKGMQVLDVGCGHGNVSAMLADLVGPGGSVVGLDQSAAAIAFARNRMQELGIANVTFIQADLGMPPGAPSGASFDAIVGRRVLMYVSDRETKVRALLNALKPGGLMVFQELDASMVPSSNVPLPLHEQVHDWIWQTVIREGATPSMGLELAPLLERAGLVLEEVRAESIVQTHAFRSETAALIRGIMHRIIEKGVATEAEMDVGTLDARLEAELSDARATFVGDMYFGVWARKPSDNHAQ